MHSSLHVWLRGACGVCALFPQCYSAHDTRLQVNESTETKSSSAWAERREGGERGHNCGGENADLQPRGGVTARRLFTSVVPLDAIKCTRFGGSPGTAGASPSPACRRRAPRSATILEITALLQRNIMNTNSRTTCMICTKKLYFVRIIQITSSSISAQTLL